MSTRNFLHRHQWQPRTDLPPTMSIREHLRHQFEDQSTVAPTALDHSQMIAEATSDLRHAIESAVWLEEGANGHFREHLAEHDDW